MDITSLIEIVIAIVVIFFFIKFVVSPALRIIFGIIVFLVLLYVLQRYFGFNLDKILSPFGIHLNLSGWGLNLDWLSGPVDYCINQVKNFLNK